MQPKKCSLEWYVDFLMASEHQFSGAEPSKVAPAEMAHDAVNRWLANTELTAENPLARSINFCEFAIRLPHHR